MEPSAPARPLYDHIEQIRVRNGWTKTRLARTTGIARTTYDAWRTQRRRPQPETVVQVAEALQLDRDEALRLAGYATGEADEGGVVDRLTAQVDALQAQVEALSAELRELRRSQGQRDAS